MVTLIGLKLAEAQIKRSELRGIGTSR